MIDPRIEELIQLEVDGNNPPEESSRLAAVLESDPEARAHFERLQAVTADLTKVGLVSAPVGLRDEIEEKLARAQGGYATGPSRPTRRAFSPREIFAFATGIAAGLALFAILGRANLPGQELDPADLRGMMVLDPHAGVLPIMDEAIIEHAALRAEVTVRSDRDFVVAELQLSNPESVLLALEYDPSALALVGCERPAAEAGEVVLGPQELRVDDPQEGPYRFVFRKRVENASSPLQLRLHRDEWSARESLGITPPPG